MPQDPTPVLTGMRNTLGNNPNMHALTAILKALRNPAFAANLDAYLQDVASPVPTKEAIIDHLNDMALDCSGVALRRQNELANTRYGIGAGAAFAFSGILGMFANPLTGIAVVPGLWIVFTCVSKTSSLREEEQLYQDIAARSLKILEGL